MNDCTVRLRYDTGFVGVEENFPSALEATLWAKDQLWEKPEFSHATIHPPYRGEFCLRTKPEGLFLEWYPDGRSARMSITLSIREAHQFLGPFFKDIGA